MAEFKFSILSINTSLKDKSVFIECALDVDEDTVTPNTVILLNKTTNSIELYDAVVEGKIIQVLMKRWPEPGDEYTILIQGGIQSVVGDKLESTLMRSFTFKSEVTSNVAIVSPTNFEKISELKIVLNETGKTTGNYYLEVAKENAFYNLTHHSEIIGKKELILTDLEPGQYYVRARAFEGKEYGRWSETITFVYEKAASTEQPSTTPEAPKKEDPIIDDTVPVIIVDEVVKLLSSPVSGTTPSDRFSFTFDSPFTMDGVEITVFRGDF